MRALDDSLRGLPPAPAGKGNGRTVGKEQAAGGLGAFEDAVANAGRQKANDQAGTGKGLGDTAAGDDTEAGALIDKDNIAKAAGRHGAATRSIAIGRDEQVLGEHALHERFPATERDLGARRATNKADTAKANADPAGMSNASVPDELAERIAALAERLAKAQANGQTTAAGDADVANGEGGEPTSASKTDMDDLLTLLGGQAVGHSLGETTNAGRQVAAGLGQGEVAGTHVAGTGEHGAKAEATAGEGDPDRLFRFARADGKGQAVTMSLSKDGEAAFDGTRSQAAKVENVTVLEARRYLGISMNPNTSAVADAIAGEVGASPLQPSAALSQPGAWTQAGKTLNTLKIQLHPIELGLVTATLRLKDDELQVELKVETGDAFRQLRDDQSEMVKALRAQGFAVDQVNIVFNSGGDTSSGGGSQAQAQAQAGQQGRERADGNGQGRQQRQDDGQASAAERWVGNGGTDDAAAGTERSRTGHVYI
ncbi:flagellar hook-length control protein FliK [Ensifer adhaerens]|uniref:flagellar hook-length control protein FliK n=1 Tax=Ensifer adhaerens TaxID=106592 RepID=UPI0023A971EC|nr:flagellar hook-length control protein FliK [Ensifer adhaerens]WDZ77220.1 flagellar hook-length control protein FliK [Ensifer adhaerens]